MSREWTPLLLLAPGPAARPCLAEEQESVEMATWPKTVMVFITHSVFCLFGLFPPLPLPSLLSIHEHLLIIHHIWQDARPWR